MTRDYVRSSQPAKRKPAAKAPAGRGKSSNTSAPFPVVRAVLALALVIGFGIFLYNISGSSGETAQVAATQSPTEAPIPIEKQRPAKEEFDYMQILQNKEVPVELPDGQIIGDPSKDPQILQQQQKMQEMLRAQQERARLLVQQQNGQLPADQTTLTQPTATLTTPAVRSVNTSKPVTTTMNTIVSGQPTAEPARTTDVRKPRSFAEVIANESNTARKPDSNVAKVTTVQPKTVTQERDEALAMFGKPRPYATDSTATKQDVAATTSTVSNKR
jgi:cell division protein FtsN